MRLRMQRATELATRITESLRTEDAAARSVLLEEQEKLLLSLPPRIRQAYLQHVREQNETDR